MTGDARHTGNERQRQPAKGNPKRCLGRQGGDSQKEKGGGTKAAYARRVLLESVAGGTSVANPRAGSFGTLLEALWVLLGHTAFRVMGSTLKATDVWNKPDSPCKRGLEP